MRIIHIYNQQIQLSSVQDPEPEQLFATSMLDPNHAGFSRWKKNKKKLAHYLKIGNNYLYIYYT